jgi:hypothetical protein
MKDNDSEDLEHDGYDDDDIIIESHLEKTLSQTKPKKKLTFHDFRSFGN